MHTKLEEVLVLGVALGIWSCGSEDTSQTGSDGVAGVGGLAGGMGGDAGVGGEAGDAGDPGLGGFAWGAGGDGAAGSSGSTIDDGCTDELAKGIAISEIAVFQAGKISVMQNGTAVVPETAQGAQIIQGKDALFRVYVTVDSDFQPRDLSAQLGLNGHSLGYYAVATISGSSSELTPENSFNIEVPGSAITSSLDYQLRIVECGDGSGTDHTPIFPSRGVAALSTRRTGTVKITMLPVTSGGVTPTLDQTFADAIRAEAESMYPTTGIEITLNDTPAGDCNVTAANPRDGDAWSACADILRTRRASDEPPDDVYYVGILKPEPTYEAYCGEDCYNGYSLIGGVNAPAFRVAVLTAYLPHVAEITFPHELGHSHGLPHSPGCGAGTPDPNFPHVSDGNGTIGWVGWDRLSSPIEFLDPTQTFDVMSYCDQLWTSDYVYRKLADRIAALNEARIVFGPARTWRVLLETTESIRWGIPITTPVSAEGEATTATVLDAQGMAVAQITVYGVRTSLGGAVYMVPEPEAGWAAIQIDGRALAF